MMINATSAGAYRLHTVARIGVWPLYASAEFDLPTDPEEEDFDDDEDEDDDSDRLQFSLEAEWR